MKLDRRMFPRWMAIIVALFIVVLALALLLGGRNTQQAEGKPIPSGTAPAFDGLQAGESIVVQTEAGLLERGCQSEQSDSNSLGQGRIS